MNDKILLTISILISNRPDTVRKCLDSIKPVLEQVPSELILVDTGCGEQVRAIIEEYTDHIIEFEWCRDFSKARNAGLEKAKGEWFLFLDDDEWFEDVGEIIDFFRFGEYRNYGLAIYTQRNYLEEDGSVYTDLPVGRMIKLEPDTRFVYRIHECFNRVKGKTKKLNAYVHHYGYVYATKEESRAHSMRNISLLLEEHKADPGNMKHTLQLVQEYNVLEEYGKSLELSLEAIQLSGQGKTNNDYFFSSVLANEIGCYMDLKEYDKAIEKGELYLNRKRPDKMVKDMIAGHLAVAYMEQKDYGKVLEYAEYYWKGYTDYLENEESFIGFITTITNKCFEEHNRSIVLGCGIHAAAALGRGELAWQWFDSFDWTAAQIFASREMMKAVVERMPNAETSERSYYVKMCNVMLGRSELEGHVLRSISDCCKGRESLEERVKALAAYEGVQSAHWFFKLREIVVKAFGQQGENFRERTEEAQNRDSETIRERTDPEVLAGEVWENPDASMSFIRTYSMMEAVEILGGDNGRILRKIPFYLWKKGITEYFRQFSWEDAGWWNERLGTLLENHEAHMLVWRAFFNLAQAVRAAGKLEGQKGALALTGQVYEKGTEGDGVDTAGKAEEDNSGFDVIKKLLGEYAGCQIALCEEIYRPEVIESRQDMLSEEYQGAYLISEMLLHTDKGRYGEAVEALKAVRRLLPGLKGVMRLCLQWIDGQLKRQEQESRQAAGEFQVLARQIKMRLRGFMNAGQYEAALSVARQMEALLPGDEEIREIIQRLG